MCCSVYNIIVTIILLECDIMLIILYFSYICWLYFLCILIINDFAQSDGHILVSHVLLNISVNIVISIFPPDLSSSAVILLKPGDLPIFNARIDD